MELLSALAPTLLMVVGGIITWLLKSRVEELRAAEESLRETRTTAYWNILEPYFALFADTSEKGRAAAVKSVTSIDYKRTAFQLVLLGSDDVVRAFNQMLKHGYEAERTGIQDGGELLRLWGALLLEIRRSLGNKKTALDEVDMLRGMVKDIDRQLA